MTILPSLKNKDELKYLDDAKLFEVEAVNQGAGSNTTGPNPCLQIWLLPFFVIMIVMAWQVVTNDVWSLPLWRVKVEEFSHWELSSPELRKLLCNIEESTILLFDSKNLHETAIWHSDV